MMAFGPYLKNMSDILNNLGVDRDDLSWWNLALCQNMDVNLFFDKYEADSEIAKNIDEACISCPVNKICYETGVDKNEYGVWGGIYLNSGSVDKTRNGHKSPETWKKLKGKYGIK